MLRKDESCETTPARGDKHVQDSQALTTMCHYHTSIINPH